MGGFILFLAIVLLFVLFIWGSRSCLRGKINKQTQAIENRTAVVKAKTAAAVAASGVQNILSVTTPDVPGREIKKVIGLVKGISGPATREQEFNLAETEAYYNMLKNAADMGANGIVNIRVSTGTYQMQGSQWQVAQLVYTGTAVLI